MTNTKIDSHQGHWLLAKMGKRVLRPGGKFLTHKMMEGLNILPSDTVVEFAPGMGYTASLTLAKNPKKYVGVELNDEAAQLLQKHINGDNRIILNRNALESGLPAECAHKVYGEAMLTMQADQRKSKIIQEANRLLKVGGLYAIHELGLVDVNEESKRKIQMELAKTLNVNARPLTESEWKTLFENEGFKVVEIFRSPMHLLERKRIIEDEGIFRTLKIAFNILTHPNEREKIVKMRRLFRKYEKNLCAFSFIMEKR